MNEYEVTCAITGEKEMLPKSKAKKYSKNPKMLELFLNSFICKKALKHLNDGKSIDQVRLKLGSNCNKFVSLELLNFNGVKYNYTITENFKSEKPAYLDLPKGSEEEFKSYTIFFTKNNTCIRPDIYMDSGRTCKHCEHNKYCLARLNDYRIKTK